MKNKILSIALVFMILPALTPAIQAQSDYEIVQSFKEKYRQLEEDIKNPQSLEELDGIYDRINSFREEYTVHRELLDRSLYPDNFNTSFEKLTNAYNVKKNDFTQIDILQVEVTGLREQLDTLNRHNEVLLNRVEILEKQSKSDKSRLAQLERTIGELRVSLQKRDEMVMNMIDSLLPQPYRERELSPQEKQEIFETYAGERKTRRDRPDRALEAGYPFTFDLIGDFGIYRDLQRHRMLTQQRQLLNPYLGFADNDDIRLAGFQAKIDAVREKAERLYEKIKQECGRIAAQYAVLFGHRIRFTMGMNLREAEHMTELRTTPQGHPSYRQICQEMARQILEICPWAEEVLKFVDYGQYTWARADSEAKQRVLEKELEERLKS